MAQRRPPPKITTKPKKNSGSMVQGDGGGLPPMGLFHTEILQK
jgi:hypothetical protein